MTFSIDFFFRLLGAAIGAVVFAALLLGGIQLALGGAMIPGSVLLVGAALSLGWVLFFGRSS